MGFAFRQFNVLFYFFYVFMFSLENNVLSAFFPKPINVCCCVFVAIIKHENKSKNEIMKTPGELNFPV